MLRGCLSDGASQAVTLDAVNRRGKPIRCEVTCTPLTGSEGLRGAILVMEDSSDGKA
jgi:two-component system CheB/CheR fusion protein